MEEARPDNPDLESEKPNERAELKEKDVSREEEKGENAPGGMEEVRSDESVGRRSSRDRGNRSEDAQTENQEVEEEQTTGSDRLTERGSRSSPSQEAELCQKQESSNAKEKQDSEGSIGSFDDSSFASDTASEAMAGGAGSKKARECQEKEPGAGKDREEDGETDGVEFDGGSDASEPHGTAGEISQGGGEVCESGTARVGPGRTLDRGVRKPSGEMKTVTDRPLPSAEVGLSVVRVRV